MKIKSEIDFQLKALRNKILKKAVFEADKLVDLMYEEKLKERKAKEDQILLKPLSSNIVHTNVICDGCEGNVIGCRYKCSVCQNFDFCEKCEELKAEEHGHSFIKIKNPSLAPVQIICIVDENVVNKNLKCAPSEKHVYENKMIGKIEEVDDIVIETTNEFQKPKESKKEEKEAEKVVANEPKEAKNQLKDNKIRETKERIHFIKEKKDRKNESKEKSKSKGKCQSKAPPKCSKAKNEPIKEASKEFTEGEIIDINAPEPYTQEANPVTTLPKPLKSEAIPNEITVSMEKNSTKTVSVVLRNVGDIEWSNTTYLSCLKNCDIGGPSVPVKVAIKPGQEISLEITLKAEKEVGDYMSIWQMCNEKGEFFGQIIILRVFIKPNGTQLEDLKIKELARNMQTLFDLKNVRIEIICEALKKSKGDYEQALPIIFDLLSKESVMSGN